VVEAEFLAKAARLGFRVSKPWGDSERYDFIVEAEIGLWRVQVKSTTCRRGPKYLLALAGHRQPYNEQEIDFLVVYVEPEDLWYVMPIEAVTSLTSLGLRPWSRKSKFDRYREAWCLLTCSRKTRGWKDIPVLCRDGKLGIRCAVCPHAQGPDQ
jgi:PD-(D/E)XK nuclease superfamily protein